MTLSAQKVDCSPAHLVELLSLGGGLHTLGRHPASTDNSKRITNRRSNAEIERQILSRVGKPVHFKYPGDEGSRRGVLKDRVVIQSNPGAQGVPYWDVADLIEFPDAPEPLWMRVGYYRYAYGRLVWGSQTVTGHDLRRFLIELADVCFLALVALLGRVNKEGEHFL